MVYVEIWGLPRRDKFPDNNSSKEGRQAQSVERMVAIDFDFIGERAACSSNRRCLIADSRFTSLPTLWLARRVTLLRPEISHLFRFRETSMRRSKIHLIPLPNTISMSLQTKWIGEVQQVVGFCFAQEIISAGVTLQAIQICCKCHPMRRKIYMPRL